MKSGSNNFDNKLDTSYKTPILSLIVPVYNEKDSISPLLENIRRSIKIPISVEVVYDNESDNVNQISDLTINNSSINNNNTYAINKECLIIRIVKSVFRR